MTVAFYLDVHIPRPISVQLRRLGVDVLTAQEDHHAEVDDEVLLDRATELGRVLVSQDKDLLVETARRQREGIPFSGLIYSWVPKTFIGACVADLRLVAEATEPEEWLNSVDREWFLSI